MYVSQLVDTATTIGVFLVEFVESIEVVLRV